MKGNKIKWDKWNPNLNKTWDTFIRKEGKRGTDQSYYYNLKLTLQSLWISTTITTKINKNKKIKIREKDNSEGNVNGLWSVTKKKCTKFH